MRTFKVIALSAILVIATAGLALACDGKKAENAAAKASSCDSKVEATTAAAKAAGCDKAEASTAATKAASCNKAEATTAAAKAGCDKTEAATAAAKGGCDKTEAATAAAKAGGCDASAKAAKTASAEAGCSSDAAAVKTASASCDAAKAEMAQSIQVETVRMPSGAMAVFYNGTCEKSTAYLQTAAAKGCEGFVCNLAKGMAADENVSVEMAKTEHGVMILVSAEEPEKVDEYEAKYAMAVASNDESSEE